METANITYQDVDGNIKVKVDTTKCIACGRCVSACKHNARTYYDNTDLFFNDLSNGTAISLIAAPAIKTNIPEYKRLFTYLKQKGVRNIYDVSLGADICIWAHVKHIQQTGNMPLITQPCPAIVTYCEIYQHNLLKNLSPVQSPMACTSIYMKEYKGINDKIAALSPCIAKVNEFGNTELANYNITFAKMLDYLKKNNIELPNEETDFDHIESGLGSLFPMPGGLKENIEFFMGKKLHILKAEGEDVYEKLNAYAQTHPELLPELFDVLNCSEGCNIGSACLHGKSIFEIEKTMNKISKSSADDKKRQYFQSLFESYNKSLDVSYFLRVYKTVHTTVPQITEDDIQAAFKLLEKNSSAEQNVDCGACGSDTCHDMARKIALNVNIPINCIVKARDTAKKAHTITLNALEQFKTIWKNVESGIVIIDAETCEIIDINPAAVRIYGDSKEKIVGKRCREVFCRTQQCPVLEQNQIVDRAEQEFTKADGIDIPIIKSVAKIHYKGRLSLLENFTDVSYIKEAEEQKRMLDVAEQTSKAKSAFLANMSHEIRTPMNAIIGMTSIGMSATDAGRKDYCLDKIAVASKHLLGIINDILDMSKIEADKFELVPAEFNFDKMMQQIVSANKFLIDEKKQKLTVNNDSNIPKVLTGDEQRLAQVITNLLWNAVKFTPHEGSISVNTQFLEEKDGFCTIKCSVSDTGIGISPEQQSRLFQAFQQTESSMSRRYGGTGLGLSISKNIVEMMGGKIWIDSELGKGATFSFTIQAKLGEEKSADGASADNTQDNIPKLEGRRVLLVEDVEINREIVMALLEPTLLAIDCAENGREAVRKFRSAPDKYDMIFMDLQMPEMDGYEAAQSIRALDIKRAKEIPIVAMTANVFQEDVEKCLQAGMNSHIGKPLNFEDVLKVLRKYIPAQN
jgi:PAS domain S-box-containing protein